MASLEEFVSAVQSSIESLKQAQSSMDAPKQQAEELSSQFQGLGAESMATGSQGLKDGVEQTQGMVPPIITRLEQIIASAQGMKNGLRAAAADVRPPPTPLDAAPPALREPVAKVGDPVTAPDEIDPTEAPRRSRRASNLIQQMTAKGDDATDAIRENTQVFDKMVSVKLDGDDFFTPQGSTTASTQATSGPVIRSGDQPAPGASDAFVATYVAAVLVTKGAQWTFDRFNRLFETWKT